MAEATSTFTIRALKAALKHIPPKQTVLLRGRHGIGKSAVAYQMAKEWGLSTIIERRISQLSEGDMIGLPDRGAEVEHDGRKHSVTRFLPTDWFLRAEYEPCLVFLDEINRGTPETMQACFQFIEKGELNGRKIHPGSRIIAAINFSKEYQVTPMDPAFLNRFWVADVEPDKDDWLAWARGDGKINDDIIDFVVQCNEDHFEVRPEKLAGLPAYEITPSRRSWERLHLVLTNEIEGSRLLDAPASPAFYDVCRGFIGPDASRAFVKFVTDRSSAISPEDLIESFDKVKARVARLKPENQVALIDKVKHYLTSKNVTLNDVQAKNVAAFMKALTPEIGITMWSAMAATSLENAAIVHKYTGKYIIDMLAETKIGQNLPQLQQIKKNKAASAEAAEVEKKKKK